MAKWPDTPVYTPITNINKGNEYQEADGLIAADINAITENIAYLYSLKDDYVLIKKPAEGQQIAYVASHDNSNDGIFVSLTKTGYTIPRRYANGQIEVGDPEGDSDAVPKKYAEDNFIPLKQINAGAFIVPQIGYNKEIYWLGSDVNLTSMSLAQRTPESRLRAADPVDQYDLVNLQYFNAHALNSDNVKTLFGNQSILGSGNIDLYFHSIQINGYRGTAQNEVVIRLNIISSNNLNCDSLTDLDTILGTSIKLSVSGYSKEASVATGIWGLTGTKISSATVNLVNGSYYRISAIQNIIVTDDVKTV